jgi:LPXTG-motif cell wall-anchored protein
MQAGKPLSIALFAFSALAMIPHSSQAEKPVAAQEPGHSKGAPGPIAGAGLPILIVAGAYWLLRRRKNRRSEPKRFGYTPQGDTGLTRPDPGEAQEQS